VKAASVVPHVGTWIEIPLTSRLYAAIYVVPHVGTWIEIASYTVENVTRMSCLT